MTNKNVTKRALLSSVMALLLCFTMLLGTTFAWFTDTASTAVNTIQAGKLDVDLEMLDGNDEWVSAEGTTLQFKTADGRTENILWEPGCTYELPMIRVINKGNLALKYQIIMTGIDGDAKLNEAIEWTYTYTAEDPSAIQLNGYEGTLEPQKATEGIIISGHMKETAGDEYQDLTIEGIAITVYATQLASEYDSSDNQYDVNAAPKTEVATAAELQKVLNEGGYAVLTANITAEDNKRFDVPEGTYAVLDLNGYTLTSKDGGGTDTRAINIGRDAVLTVNDSVGTGKIVSSCYGVYVWQNAKFIMNGGTLSVSGNGRLDYGVILWNADFVMNGGIIESRYGVWTSNYFKDAGEADLNPCYVKIADDCVLNSTLADVNYSDALDAVIDVPAGISLSTASDD